jgi:hypothetical protein
VELSAAMGSSSGQTEIRTVVNGRKTKLTAMESIYGQTEENTLDNGPTNQ